MPSGADKVVKGLKEAGVETLFDKPGQFNYSIGIPQENGDPI